MHRISYYERVEGHHHRWHVFMHGRDERLVTAVREIVDRFSIEGITNHPAIFDYDKLRWDLESAHDAARQVHSYGGGRWFQQIH